MRIRLTTNLAGPTGGKAGEIVDWKDAEEAKRLIEAGYAIPVSKPKRDAKKKMSNVEKRAVHGNK